MKAFAARPEDLNDLRFLARALRLHSAEDALAIVEKYYPRSRIPAKTQFFLEETFGPEQDR